jgi:hypothetical protein
MALRTRHLAVLGLLAGGLIVGANLADAKCTRLAFSVNDYGKDGPTKDAKELLEQHIASWAAQQGIKGYSVGKKDVSCELFLDFIVFDEHTCQAEASVCWDEGPAKPKPRTAAPAGRAPKPAAVTGPVMTGSVPKTGADEAGGADRK